MKQLMMMRLWFAIEAGAVIVGVGVLADLLCGGPAAFAAIGLPFLPICNQRSTWFLNARYSRWTLALYVLLEATLHSCLAYIFMRLFFIFLRFREHMYLGETEDMLYWGCAVMGLVSVLMPIRNPVVTAGFDPIYFVRMVSRHWIKAAFAIALGFGWYYFWKESPLWYFGVLLAFAALAISEALRSVALPQDHYLAVKRGLRTGAGAIFVLLPLIAWAVLQWAPPSWATESSFVVLHGLPKVDLPESRRLEIARSPASTYWHDLGELSESSKQEISFQEWKKRSETCALSSCLDLSDQILPEESRKDLARLEVLLQKCDLQPVRGTAACNGIRPNRPVMERWFKVLRESPQLEEWLNSENPIKRYAALKSLVAENIRPEAMQILKAQRDAPDRMLASVAASTLEYQSGAAHWAGHCEEENLQPDAKAFCERLRDGDWSRF
jgi:hypothetical protein